MKRIHKIVILFIAIFLIGILSFVGYINYSLNKKEAIHAVKREKPAKKSTVKMIYIY